MADGAAGETTMDCGQVVYEFARVVVHYECERVVHYECERVRVERECARQEPTRPVAKSDWVRGDVVST